MCSILTRWSFSSLSVVIILFATHFSYGQGPHLNSFELPLEREALNYEVSAARNNGLFVHRRLYGGKEDQLELIKLDTAFAKQWHGYLALDKRWMLMGKRTSAEHFFLLFRHIDPRKKDFFLFAIDSDNGNYIKYTIHNFIPFIPTDFQVTQLAAIIGGYYNQVPVVIHFQFSSNQAKVLPGLLNEKGELNQIYVDESGSFDVLIAAKNFFGQQTIFIKSYDPSGTLLSNVALKPELNKHLIFGRSINTNDDQRLVAGVYGGKNSAYSKGIFVGNVQGGETELKYYDYADLHNFFKYMKAKREKRVKDRIERRKIKGKKVKFNYRFLVHQIVPYNDQYVLLGEAFYPTYTNLDRFSYAGSYRVFDGYRYTHAVVIGFSPQGKLLWDNSFEINDVKTYTLEQFVKLETEADRIALIYLFENELRSKIIKGNDVIEGTTVHSLEKSAQPKNKYRQEISTKLDYWYDDYFFASGVKEIPGPGMSKQKIFFINKVTVPF